MLSEGSIPSPNNNGFSALRYGEECAPLRDPDATAQLGHRPSSLRTYETGKYRTLCQLYHWLSVSCGEL
jgi:hypothetical protein